MMIYALLVAVLSLAGAAVPLRARPTHAQLQIYLSLAAGALLGAAIFHLLPEASHVIGERFAIPLTLGVVTVFLLQRYLAPHSHEPGGETHDDGPEVVHAEHDHSHAHDHASEQAHPAASLLGGFVAIAGLAIHSFFDGVAIGAASTAVDGHGRSVAWSVFLSVLIHKPLDGLSVSVLLLNARAHRPTLWTVQLLYAALVPLGAGAFVLTQGAIEEPTTLIGYTLAFSAGAFLSIALADLLPELHFHRHDRNWLSLAMLAGLGIMLGTSLLGHEHEHEESQPLTPATQGAAPDEHDESHHDHGH